MEAKEKTNTILNNNKRKHQCIYTGIDASP